MISAESPFYKSGGTLAPDEPSYVSRVADEDLHARLLNAQFCYLLTSRQMGKSSLMNRTATRLERDGVAVAKLDLTAIGQNVSAEQWYDGLVYEIGRHTRLKRQLDDCWQANAQLGPLHRFLITLRDGLLTHIDHAVVIFIDEIEVVRSLQFSTDEFFAAIRECHNRRASEPEMRRLTFCLFGMATPQELIADTRITPFNIGRRIDLADFTGEEALPLAQGLDDTGRDGGRLLRRILHWTAGHPYLTQRFCLAVAQDSSIVAESDVDRVCGELFLSEHARESEANLAPLREYILNASPDRTAILETYGKVLSGKPVASDAKDPTVEMLQLSGIVRNTNGRLRVRNRIYERVFDRAWVRANLPNAALQRQRAAFLRILGVSTALFAVVITIMIGLTVEASRQANLAHREAIESSQETRSARQEAILAQQREMAEQQLLYVADINLASQALERHDIPQVVSLLHAHQNDPMAGFEYRYLTRMCHQDYYTCRAGSNYVYSVSFSPDGRYLATAGADGSIRVWDRARRRQIRAFPGSTATIAAVAFSPDGRRLVGAVENTMTVWDTASWRKIAAIPGDGAMIAALRFSPGRGLSLAAGEWNGKVLIYDTRTWRPELKINAHTGTVYSVAFSPDGRQIATAGADKLVKIWDVATGTMLRVLRNHTAAVRSVAYSPDGASLAAGSEDETIMLWDTGDWRLLRTLYNNDVVCAVAFSPVTGQLATAGADTAVKLWDVDAQTTTSIFDGHLDQITDLAFSRDGRWLASSSWDYTAKIWDTNSTDYLQVVPARTNLWACALSPDGHRLAGETKDDRTRIWDVAGCRQLFALPNHGLRFTAVALSAHEGEIATADGTADGNQHIRVYDSRGQKLIWSVSAIGMGSIYSLAFSPNDRYLAAGDANGTVQVWRPPGSLFKTFSIRGARDAANSLAFSPNGVELAVGRESFKVTVLSLDNNNSQSLSGHSGAVKALAFSPDGRTLASGSTDLTVKLWNLATGREMLTMPGNDGRVESLAFARNGNGIEIVNNKGMVRVWQAAERIKSPAK